MDSSDILPCSRFPACFRQANLMLFRLINIIILGFYMFLCVIISNCSASRYVANLMAVLSKIGLAPGTDGSNPYKQLSTERSLLCCILVNPGKGVIAPLRYTCYFFYIVVNVLGLIQCPKCNPFILHIEASLAASSF